MDVPTIYNSFEAGIEIHAAKFDHKGVMFNVKDGFDHLVEKINNQPNKVTQNNKKYV